MLWRMKDKCGLQQNKYYSLLVITVVRCSDGRTNIQYCIYFIELTFYLSNISYTDDVTTVRFSQSDVIYAINLDNTRIQTLNTPDCTATGTLLIHALSLYVQ